jgi:hypothetical protein
MADSWDDSAYLRGTQYKSDANLAPVTCASSAQQSPRSNRRGADGVTLSVPAAAWQGFTAALK